MAGELGLIDPQLAQEAGDAYRDYRRQQHAERLSGAKSARVNPAEWQTPRSAVTRLWQEVFAEAPGSIRDLHEIHDSRREG
jgi:glutamate-ammonia-ligase adenylyltransferase